MDLGSQVPINSSHTGVHTQTPHGPSYVEQQHQSAVGSLPPPSASARAVGLLEILGNKRKADQGPP